MTHTQFLSSPFLLKGHQIKNRIVVPPMADFGATDTDGLVNSRHLKRYTEFAAGGAGLIITEACTVCQVHEERNTIGVFDDSCITGMAQLAKVIKQNNTVALVQLLNAGINYLPYRSIEEIPSDVFYKYKQEFIDAAIRCKKAGFDGVELHAAHGFYLNQVIETSERTDGYGGTFNCRVRLLSELIQEIRQQCGSDFIIAVRFGNHSTDELIATGKIIEAAGGDILDISSGMGAYQKPEDFPFDSKIFAASCVKKEVSLPVICVGNIDGGEVAEQVLQDGYADLIAVGRGHLCDPAWGNKVLHGKEPIKCLHCRNCMWYIDGEKCPAVKERRKRYET